MSRPAAGIDWFILLTGSGLLLVVVLSIIVFPETSDAVISRSVGFLTRQLGVVYVFAAISVFLLLLGIAFSRYGAVHLGDGDPVYSTFSWTAMMFCAGIGASLIYLSAIEWVYYFEAPPFGIEAGSDESIGWAASYGIFHWGPIGWAFYCLPAVAIACSYYIKGDASLRISDACAPVLGDSTRRWPGRTVDLLFIIGLIGTAATGLGLGTSVVSSATTRLTGLPDGLAMQSAIIVLATALIAFSVYRGMDRGIKVLSNINAVLALVLIAFVVVVGPTRFILEMGVMSIGRVLQNFIHMLTWTDPLEKSSFVEDWTVFYWAWWIALGPFVGMFVCKISAGRSVRSVILGMLGWGSLGCTLFFIVLGNYALFLDINDIFPVVNEVRERGGSSAVAGIIQLLPFGSFWLVYLAVIGLVFIATTYDSASYTLAAGASRSLPDNGHPARGHRVFWACLLGVLPVCLLFLGGLKMLQSASVIASVPIVVVYGMLTVSMLRTLHETSDGPGETRTPE